jgi:16S rRNA (cytosine967-C5)-methyltransferase
VLRRAAREKAAFRLPDPVAEPLERLAVEWSHPRWLVERWARDLAHEELASLLAANNRRGPTTLRSNPGRTTREALVGELAAAGVAAAPSPWALDGIVVARGAARLRALPAWTEGRFAYQGEASQLIAPLLGGAGGARILDACAAPGGKTLHAATLVGPSGLVVGLDRHLTGLRRLGDEAARLGAHAVRICGDAGRPPCTRPFDAVLVDAPCSGLGTLRRHPELRWRRRPADIPRLAALQLGLLAGVAPLVRPGGILVYAVCTLTQEENEGVVQRFLGAHPRFVREDARTQAPEALVTSGGALTTFPHRHGLDGFFAVRLRG